MLSKEPFKIDNGIFVPKQPIQHRDEEYDEHGFDILINMQRKHFWYRGRHKFILKVFQNEIGRTFGRSDNLQAIDLGGGCGGWVEYLHHHAGGTFGELALGDSSIRALSMAGSVVEPFATRYQIDLLNLHWSEKWDVVFLLDVLEHIPEHEEALQQIRNSMRPGSLLFITTPALKFFWTYNDDVVHHQRRYSKQDFLKLGKAADLKLIRAEYFMFFLSPVLLLSRMLFKPSRSATLEQMQKHIAKSHQIPMQPINTILTQLFSLEAALVNKVSFPWGTSILAVFRS